MKNFLSTPLHILICKIAHRLAIKTKDYFYFKKACSNKLSDRYEKLFLKNSASYFSYSGRDKNNLKDSVHKEILNIDNLDNLINFKDKQFISENLRNKKLVIKTADLFRSHIFNLLGSGQVKVSYRLKPKGVENNVYKMAVGEKEIRHCINKINKRVSAIFKDFEKEEYKLLLDYEYDPIDWHVDFKSGYRWDCETWYKKVKFGNNPGVDIKVPWELSRCYHFLNLGQAYFITGDEKYTKEFIYQFFDWIENNPVQFGVNWVCTMDVSIRACNWILSLIYFKNSKLISEEFLYVFIKNIFFHGLHIKKNLEKDPFGVRTNHYISNLTGLIYIGKFLNNSKFGKKLLDFAINELNLEIKNQIYNDGSSYEASTCYHRLVLELLFYPMLFLTKSHKEFDGYNFKDTALKIFGGSYFENIFNMFSVLKYCINPEGQIPQIGDNDNGRLHVFDYPSTLDVTYLLQIASVFFNESSFKIDDFEKKDAVLWIFGKTGSNIWDRLNGISLNSIESKAFLDSSWFVMRKNNNYLILSAGQNGQNKSGGHAHNDKLSFELCINSKKIIIDPGTYLYTASPEWRNKFRSTSYHNTVSVDNREQNKFLSKSLFLLENDSNVKINQWETNESFDLLDAEHYGFTKFENPVTHQRQILFDKNNIRIYIKDIIKGEGKHLFEIFFHLNRDIEFEEDDNNKLVLLKNLNNKNYKLFSSSKNLLKFEIIQSWDSCGYGEKVRNYVLRFFKKIEAPFESLFIIAEESYEFNESDFNKNL